MIKLGDIRSLFSKACRYFETMVGGESLLLSRTVKSYVSLHNVSAPLRLRRRRSGLRKHSHVLSGYSITCVVAKHCLYVHRY